MASHRPGPSGHRKVTHGQSQSIPSDDATASSDDSDDLDMVPRKKRVTDMGSPIGHDAESVIEVSSGNEESRSTSGKRKRPARDEPEEGVRMAFDDDEDSDAAYKKFKQRKSDHRKKVLASTRKAKANSKNPPVVGRKPKSIINTSRSRRPKRELNFGQDEDDGSDLLDDALPQYLKDRRAIFDDNYEKLKTAGLQTPPDYDKVYFSDNERMATLEERPHLPESVIQAEYEDVVLHRSLGVVPASIAQYLRPYQIRGAEFLHELFVYQTGGILGDDMGLGKTIQVIAFLTAAFGKTGDERDNKRMRKMRRMSDGRWYPRVLIICPGSLIANWKAEFGRWGWWHTYTYHKNQAQKKDAIAAAESGRLEIMFTTYDTYRNEKDAINTIRWDCVIADECHKIKSNSAEITKSMNDVNALCRIGLSGTSIQNKYEELWTLLNWTNPGKLGSMMSWRQSICEPLKMGQSHDATVPQLAQARRIAEKLVKNLLPAFFLRRTKALIAHQLPKKTDVVVFCPLTGAQAEAYDQFCDSEMVHTIRNAAVPCSCGSGLTSGYCCSTEIDGYGKWQNYMFPCMSTLQKISVHLALLIPSGTADPEKHEKELDYLKMAVPDKWEQLYTHRDNIVETMANEDFCGKWRVLKKLLQLWHANGDKVLIFSMSVRLLDSLRQLFTTTTSYNVLQLDGSVTNLDERQAIVDEFNSDPAQFVFLISTKAGGVGLNITSANKVVVIDPNWNPSYDLQAQDRAYRIGQTRDVAVFRLISKGTIEEIVYARQIYKQQQANIGYNATAERRYFKGVQGQKEMKGEIFGLRNMFMPLSDNVKLQDIVNKTNIAETKAGFDIAELEFEATQDADEDGEGFGTQEQAIKQLEEEILTEVGANPNTSRETAKRKDPVSAILAAVGVEYTHDNSEVIGTSKIESKISSRAQKAGNDMGFAKDRAFGQLSSQLEPDSDLDDGGGPGMTAFDEERAHHFDKYKYRPREEVRKRQFCSMARHFGYEDVTDFALVVEGWTQGQRRDCLDKFYRDRRVQLASG